MFYCLNPQVLRANLEGIIFKITLLAEIIFGITCTKNYLMDLKVYLGLVFVFLLVVIFIWVRCVDCRICHHWPHRKRVC